MTIKTINAKQIRKIAAMVCRIKYLILYLFILILLRIIGIEAQEVTETPTTNEMQPQSIFADDACNPPCWFGLIPGDSTSQDAVAFLTTSERIAALAARENGQWFYQTQGELPAIVNGFYIFDFGPSEVFQCCGIYSRINIRDGIVYDVSILMLQVVIFTEAIEKLGLPDEIRMGRYETVSSSSPYSQFFFSFIYLDTRLRVGFTTDKDLQHPLICHYEELAENLRVRGARYYSPLAASELVDVYTGDKTISQPALLAYIPEERYVPPEIWANMMENDSVPCRELWETLPEERFIPESWDKAAEE